jgi:hypothetical protein
MSFHSVYLQILLFNQKRARKGLCITICTGPVEEYTLFV